MCCAPPPSCHVMQGLLSNHYRSSPTLRTTMMKIEACVDSGKLQMKEGVGG